MNDDTIADLKQFIAATVLQATADLPRRDELATVEAKLESRIVRLGSDMAARLDDLEAKLETVADAHAETLEEYEVRLRRLELGT